MGSFDCVDVRFANVNFAQDDRAYWASALSAVEGMTEFI
jgi:hypothetical protein